MSPPAGKAPGLALLLALDGVVHTSDLPVQSFARHLTAGLPPDGVHTLIAGMRGFLEGKPELLPAEVDLGAAEDGYQAVETMARAAGRTDEQIAAARAASRADLAASAWAVDEADGLVELLAGPVGTAYVGVLAEAGDPAPAAVLDALEISAVQVLDLPFGTALTHVLDRLETPDAARVLVIGTGWSGQLAEAHDAGCATALVDRYRLDRATPTFRSTDLLGLVGSVNRWRMDADRRPAATAS